MAASPRASPGRSALRARPVITAGGFCTFEMAETALANGHTDTIASARQSLADPGWFRKMRLGAGEAIRRCVFTNHCEGLDQMHQQVTCKLRDRDFDGEAPAVPLSLDGKRRLVPPDWES